MMIRLFFTDAKGACLAFLILLYCTVPSRGQFVFFNRSTEFPHSAVKDLLNDGPETSILYGETHTFFFEPTFKYEMIVHQNSLYGTRDIFMEIGYSAAFLYTKFLETGDTSYIYNRGIAYVPRRGNYREMWRKLHDYNKALPANLKLRIHGVDFERHEIYKALVTLIPPDKMLPAELQSIFSRVRSHAEDQCQSFESEFKRIRTELQAKYTALEALYGNSFPLVQKILENDLSSNFTKVRDKRMSDNMEREIRDLGISRFIGFFGGLHTTYKSPTSIANFFKSKEAWKDKLKVINATYINALSPFTMKELPYIGLVLDEDVLNYQKRKLDENNYQAMLIKKSEAKIGWIQYTSDYYLIAYDK